ncbi:hypothetical protein AWE51_20445 [Aquimarina aggregata]|uniref:MotA/TolQ/ExbB proton channel domain-containing protein n=1 Tax=Aquimarina aggregata TaxID=1642818 RepID=A0A163BTZ5_9FLAO|nr:MotA/TolQ/ExbB proton channel family protein [Aquimarina aggregata]KZS41767.1 hypothetical protein AWE51_20445 [Aquimarina aggregata]
MMLLFSIIQENQTYFSVIYKRMQEGGMFFMFPILVTLFLIFFLILKKVLILKKEGAPSYKYIKLINSLGLMILVWGILGQLIGLVDAFDKIEMLGEISTARLAGGLKISALPTMFGSLVFVISRAATTIFIWITKEVDLEK